jgi:dipeptidyl aminopeptidase/acylaminoacyl peptidase
MKTGFKLCKGILAILLLLVSPKIDAQNKLTPELLWKLGRVSEIQLSPDGSKLLYGVTWYSLQENRGNRDLYVIPTTGGTPVKLTTFEGPDFNGVWRPDGKKIGYISTSSGEAQMWEMNPDGSGKIQVSEIKGGINSFSYAPDARHILYCQDVKLDPTTQDVYPDLPLADAMIIEDLMYRHWDSWHDYAYSHIFVATYQDGKPGAAIDIMPGEKADSPLMPNGGMEQIVWSPDGSKIAYTCKKLKGLDYAISTNSDIYLYDLAKGTTDNLSADNQGYDMEPSFSPDGKYLVWASMKTPGFEADKSRIMLYEFATGKTRDMTTSFDQSSSTFKWHPVNPGILYFISGIKATYQVYELNVKTGAIRQITAGPHDYTELEVGSKGMYGVRMSLSSPSEIYQIVPGSPAAAENQLSFTNKEILKDVTMGRVEERWITTTDNKKMLTWVIYPPDFDKTKKYPALLYCQGGPQSAVSQFWSYRWCLQMMAANGYIVVAPNRRGLPTFGQEWNDEISGDYGGQNMKDYLTAIDSVSTDPWIDKMRLGAVGASYGAFSVYWLAGHHEGRFHAFIAHCGMFNLESWYGSTEEYWFPDYDLGGPYWDKNVAKNYDVSPHKFIGNWDTPILVIHGGKDFRIPYTEGMQAFDCAQLKGVPSKFLFFPNETHFVTKPQNSVLWHREFFKWLDTYLK